MIDGGKVRQGTPDPTRKKQVCTWASPRQPMTETKTERWTQTTPNRPMEDLSFRTNRAPEIPNDWMPTPEIERNQASPGMGGMNDDPMEESRPDSSSTLETPDVQLDMKDASDQEMEDGCQASQAEERKIVNESRRAIPDAPLIERTKRRRDSGQSDSEGMSLP